MVTLKHIDGTVADGLEADMTSSQVFDDIDDVANRPTKPVDTPDD